MRSRNFLSRLADRLILEATQHEICADGKCRQLVPCAAGQLEVWTQRAGPARTRPDLYLLKFQGTGGRAELATAHPAEAWPELAVEVWAVNMPGYGGSIGPACLAAQPEAIDRVWEALEQQAEGCPIVITGNSLGSAAALYTAAQGRGRGVLLRNPPPLRELILGQYGWWNLTLGARLIANQVPPEFDSIANARRSSIPALFVRSGRDCIVPPRYQQLIYDAYAGPKQLLELPEADHASLLSEAEQQQYVELLKWFGEAVRG